MADKYIILHSSGVAYVEKEATTQSAGAANAGQILALNSRGEIDVTALPPGIGPDTLLAPASEALAAGNFVNEWVNNGVASLRKADASAGIGKAATHFVLAAAAAGQNATAYPIGANNALSGLTPGAPYFLSATAAGGVTVTPIATAGQVNQFLGYAKDANTINFVPGRLTLRA